MIASCGVIGHKVDYHIHTGIMRACHECLKLIHSLVDIDSDVRVDVIIILYGIW